MFLGSNLYSCDFCGFEMNWDKKDNFHGEMWGCEKCGRGARYFDRVRRTGGV